MSSIGEFTDIMFHDKVVDIARNELAAEGAQELGNGAGTN